MDISKLSKEEKAELLRKLKEEEKTESIRRKETYEALRHQFMFDVESKLMPVVNDVQGFYDWIVGESKAFRNVMREYGQLRMRQGEETATFFSSRRELQTGGKKQQGEKFLMNVPISLPKG